MMERGDLYHMAICNKTGMIAVYNPSKDILFSPMADGPIQYTGSLSLDDELGGQGQVHVLSKYGRDFSIVAVPYAFKLFMQELMTINIRMCIITEDNISQMENMGFSNSLDSLLFQKNAVPKTVIDQTRAILSNEKIVDSSISNFETTFPLDNSAIIPSKSSPDYPPRITPKYYPHSPAYTAPNSPENSSRDSIPPPSPDSTPPNYVKPSDSIVKEIKGGDKVHYRGDYNPSRLWTVQHTGDKFYTIDTDNLEGLTTEDSIKVITPEEIYLPDDLAYSMPYTFAENPNMMLNPMTNPNQNMHPMTNPNQNMHPCDTQINFAPIIKIINDGNDMSSSSEPVSGPVPIANEVLIPEQTAGQLNTNIEAEPINFDKPILIKKL